MIHCRSPVDACMVPAMVGSARLSTVRSRLTTSTLTEIAAIAHQRRAESFMRVTTFRVFLLNESYSHKIDTLNWQRQA